MQESLRQQCSAGATSSTRRTHHLLPVEPGNSRSVALVVLEQLREAQSAQPRPGPSPPPLPAYVLKTKKPAGEVEEAHSAQPPQVQQPLHQPQSATVVVPQAAAAAEVEEAQSAQPPQVQQPPRQPQSATVVVVPPPAVAAAAAAAAEVEEAQSAQPPQVQRVLRQAQATMGAVGGPAAAVVVQLQPRHFQPLSEEVVGPVGEEQSALQLQAPRSLLPQCCPDSPRSTHLPPLYVLPLQVAPHQVPLVQVAAAHSAIYRHLLLSRSAKLNRFPPPHHQERFLPQTRSRRAAKESYGRRYASQTSLLEATCCRLQHISHRHVLS